MKASFYFSFLCAILVLIPAIAQATFHEKVQASVTDIPIAWSNFSFIPVTYNNGIIADYESSSDPSRGTAAVNPADTDISSCSSDGYLPGNQPSFLYGYYNAGTPGTLEDDHLALRMRLNASPLEQNEVGLDSRHWYILIDIDNDGFKEFAVDIDGTIGANKPDRVYLLYNNLPTNSINPRSGAQRSNSDIPGGDEINLWYASGPAASGAAQIYNHTRVLAATPTCFGGSEFWLDVQLPVSSFNVNGIQLLDNSTPARFFISTSASAVDPLQKDWMLKIQSDPVFSDPWGPSISALKTATLLMDNDGNGMASPGDVLRYDIQISNSGLLAMQDVVFSDNISDSNLKLEDNVTTTSGSIVKGNAPTDNEVIVNIGAIASGSSENISFRVTILDTFAPGVNVVSNQGVVSGTNFTSIRTDDPATPAPGDATRTVVTVPPRLQITKEGPDQANTGSYITFTGTLTNYGSVPAENVTMVDYLPSGLVFISSSHSAVYNAGDNTVTWDLGNLEGGSSVSGWLTVLVNGDILDGTILTNTFSVTWEDSGGKDYGPATAVKDVIIRSKPILSITKSGPSTGSPSNLITYTGTLTNTGSTTAYNVILADHLPAGLTFESSSHGAVYDPGTNTVTWNLGNLGGGMTVHGWLTARVNSGVPNGTALTNTFSLNWEDSEGISCGPENSSVTTTIYTVPQITITKEGPHEATVGSYITFTGTLTNVGGSTAGNVILVDYLPAGLTYIGSSHTAVYDPVAHTVTWYLGNVGSEIAVPGWVELRVDDNVPNGTDLINTFSATWEDAGGGSYGPATASTDVIARTSPILEVTKSGPVHGSPGGTLTFTLTVANYGGLDALNTVLIDMLPDKYTLVSSTPPGIADGGNVAWNVGTVSSGSTISVSLTVQVDDTVANETPLVNTAIVNWQDAQGNSHGPVSSSLTTTLFTVPHLSITKTGPATANPGIDCTYTITLANSSNAAANDITLVDYIPDHMIYIGSSPAGIFIGDNVTWNIGTISGGGSSSVSITLRVDPSLDENVVLKDIAVVDWKDVLENKYGPASDTSQTISYPFPVLSLSINGPATGEPCDTLTFRLEVTNTSATLPANNVLLQYILPSGSLYASSSDGGAYSNGMVIWNLGTMTVGSLREVSLTITYCVIPAGSEIISTASVDWQYPDGTTHGPVFNSMGTRIVAATIPTPPEQTPIAPAATPPAQSLVTLQPPSHSASISTRPWQDKPVQLPNLVVQSASLSSTKVDPGVPVTITAILLNRSTVNRSTKVTVYVNGEAETSCSLVVNSGSSVPLQFNIYRNQPGVYRVYVDSTHAGNFTVSDTVGSSLIFIISCACILTALILGIILIYRRINGEY